MNLSTTVEIYAGGPGSGCNPAVAKPRCGRPSKGTPTVSKSVKVGLLSAFEKAAKGRRVSQLEKAAERLEKIGLDERYSQHRPIRKIVVLSKARPDKFVHGRYSPEWASFRFKEDSSVRTFLHEFGHHLDFRWARNDIDFKGKKESEPFVLDSKALTVGRYKMDNEFFRALGRAGMGYGPTEYFSRSAIIARMGIKKLRIPSVYSLHDEGEWFAESFRLYSETDAGPRRLKAIAPNTFRFIDNLVKGTFFSEGRSRR